MLLFCRLLPTISVAELKAVMPVAQPSHGGHAPRRPTGAEGFHG